jgi:hypothetical protein
VDRIGLVLERRDGGADGGVHAAGEADDRSGCGTGAAGSGLRRRCWLRHSHPTSMQEGVESNA